MRKSDKKKAFYPRTDNRFFRSNHFWFCRTREGARGPFPSVSAAEREMLFYVDTMKFVDERRDTFPPGIDCRDVTLIEVSAPSSYAT